MMLYYIYHPARIGCTTKWYKALTRRSRWCKVKMDGLIIEGSNKQLCYLSRNWSFLKIRGEKWRVIKMVHRKSRADCSDGSRGYMIWLNYWLYFSCRPIFTWRELTSSIWSRNKKNSSLRKMVTLDPKMYWWIVECVTGRVVTVTG